jgi:hypothetical protein
MQLDVLKYKYVKLLQSDKINLTSYVLYYSFIVKGSCKENLMCLPVDYSTGCVIETRNIPVAYNLLNFISFFLLNCCSLCSSP